MKAKMTATMLVALLAATQFSWGASAEQVEFNYSGRVNVQSGPFTGTGHFKFSLVTDGGATTLWANDGLALDGGEPVVAVAVPVTNGLFSVDVGDTSLMHMVPLLKRVFESDGPIHLRVWFSDGVNRFERLSPDRKITNADLLSVKVARPTAYTLYVNGAAGDDRNPGLEASKPKKTIQAAIDALPARLKADVTIDVAAGVYRETVVLADIAAAPGKRLILRGDAGWTTPFAGVPNVRIAGSDAGADGTPVRETALRLERCANVKLEGLLLDRATQYGLKLADCAAVAVERCKLTSSTLGGALVQDSVRLSCTDCFFESNGGSGARLEASRGAFTRARFKANGDSGLHAIGGALDFHACEARENGANAASPLKVGMHFSRGASAFFYTSGIFSDNAGDGLRAEDKSYLRFKDGYGGEIHDNGGYGIYVLYDSLANGYAKNSFSGNASGPTGESGGGVALSNPPK